MLSCFARTPERVAWGGYAMGSKMDEQAFCEPGISVGARSRSEFRSCFRFEFDARSVRDLDSRSVGTCCGLNSNRIRECRKLHMCLLHGRVVPHYENSIPVMSAYGAHQPRIEVEI